MSHFDPDTESYDTTLSHPFNVTEVAAGAEGVRRVRTDCGTREVAQCILHMT